MRDLLTALAIFIIIVLTGALVGPHLVDWDAQRGRVEQEMTARLGVPIRVRGDIAFRILPSPRFDLGQVAIGDADPARAPLTIARILVDVDATPLLKGDIRVTNAVVESPRLMLEAMRDGSSQRAFAALSEKFTPDAIAIEKLTVRDAFLLHGRPGEGAEEPMRFSGEFSALSLAGPWRGSGELTVGAKAHSVRIATGRLENDGRLRFKAGIGVADGAINAEFDGAALFGGATAALRLEGRITASGAARLANARDAPATPWKLVATGTSDGPAFAADNVEFEGGPDGIIKLAGSGRLALAPRPALELDLASRQIDFDRSAAQLGLADNGGLDSKGITALLAGLPLDVRLALALERMIAGGEAHGPGRIALALGNGRIAIEQASLRLAGAAEITLTGKVIPAEQPVALGRFELVLDDPSRAGVALLRLRGTDPMVIALRGAGRVTLRGSFQGEGGAVSINEGEATLGSTTITGRLRLARTGPDNRPEISANLTATRFDLDLLSLVTPENDSAADVTLALAAASTRATATGDRDLGRLAIRLRSRAGELDIERLELSGAQDTKFAIFGRLAPGGGRVTAEIEARRLDAVADILRPLLPPAVLAQVLRRGEALSPVKATIVVSRDRGIVSSAKLLGTLAGSRVEGELAFAGRAADDVLGGIDRIELALDNADGARLLGQIGFSLPAEATLPAGKLRLRLENAAGNRRWSIESTIAGTMVGGEGQISDDPLLPIKGRLAVQSTDARMLARVFGWPLARAGAALPLDLSGGIEASSAILRLTRFGGKFARSTLSADLDWLPASRPARITGSVSFAELALDDAIALTLGEATATSKDGAAPFAAAPALPIMLDLNLRSGRLLLSPGLTATAAAFALAADADGIRISTLQADLAGGQIRASGQLRRQSPVAATLDARIVLDDLDAARFLAGSLGQPTTIAGRLGLTLDLSTVGASLMQWTTAANGGGEIVLSEALLPRLDPGALARTLRAVDPDTETPSPSRFEATLAGELDAGPLIVSRLAAPLSLNAGVARIGPAAVESAGQTLQGQAVLALQSGELDIRTTLGTRERVEELDGSAHQIGLSFAGDLRSVERHIDAALALNALTVRMVKREIARVEAMEADQRERSQHNRRLRAEREAAAAERSFAELMLADVIEQALHWRRLIAEREADARERETTINDPEGWASLFEQGITEATAAIKQPVAAGDRRRPVTGRPRTTPGGSAPQLPPPLEILPRTTFRPNPATAPVIPPQ